MKERPIIFSAPMVRALLDGRKTQTRRLVKPQPEQGGGGGVLPNEWYWPHPKHHSGIVTASPANSDLMPKLCPYGVPGDRLWVRETWDYFGGDEYLYQQEQGAVLYRADTGGAYPVRGGRPSIHMPRWASRITLEVLRVRVERLQDISEEGAKAEGVEPAFAGRLYPSGRAAPLMSHVRGFADAWNKLNGQRAPWSSNPWVWVIQFTRAQP